MLVTVELTWVELTWGMEDLPSMKIRTAMKIRGIIEIHHQMSMFVVIDGCIFVVVLGLITSRYTRL